MCGRFVSTTPPGVLADHFGAEQVVGSDPGPRYNVAPTTPVWVVHSAHGHRVVEAMRWGLVPPWAKDLAIGSRMINARRETIASKRSFAPALARRRGVVCADGFYEWHQPTGGGPKQPWYFSACSGAPLALAALWEQWSPRPTEGSDADAVVLTCTIITTTAVDPVTPVHHRMPVVLEETGLEAWLDPAAGDPGWLCSLLDEHGSGGPTAGLVAVPVGTAVNNPRNDGPDLIKEVVPGGRRP